MLLRRFLYCPLTCYVVNTFSLNIDEKRLGAARKYYFFSRFSTLAIRLRTLASARSSFSSRVSVSVI